MFCGFCLCLDEVCSFLLVTFLVTSGCWNLQHDLCMGSVLMLVIAGLHSV